MRRRILLALTLVVGVILFPTSASATDDLLDFQLAVDEMLAVDPTLDPPPNDGKHDFVVGGFRDVFGYNNGLSAHSGPGGGRSARAEKRYKPRLGAQDPRRRRLLSGPGQPRRDRRSRSAVVPAK